MVLFWFLGFCFLFLIFLAPLGLPCCVRVFSSCAVRASPCGGFSCCREWTLEWKLQQLWLGLTALWHVGSSWTRDRIHVPHTGRQILNHWTNKKVPLKLLCGNFMILSSKKKKKPHNLKVMFYSGMLLRTVVWKTTSQLALRNHSKDIR